MEITKEFMGENKITTYPLPQTGLAETIAAYSLDTAKVRSIAATIPFGVFGVFRDRRYGFAGIEAAVANVAIQKYFIKPVLFSPFDQLSKSSVFLAGACAGCVQAVFSCPLEVIKTYTQVNPLNFPRLSVTKAAQLLFNTRGFSIFFSGLEASMCQLALQGGLFYTLLFPVRKAIAARLYALDTSYLTRREKLITNITAGVAVGLLTTLVVHPIDVARTLIQGFANDEAPWLIPFLFKLIRERGLGIFAGYGATALQVAVVSPLIAVISYLLNNKH